MSIKYCDVMLICEMECHQTGSFFKGFLSSKFLSNAQYSLATDSGNGIGKFRPANFGAFSLTLGKTEQNRTIQLSLLYMLCILKKACEKYLVLLYYTISKSSFRHLFWMQTWNEPGSH